MQHYTSHVMDTFGNAISGASIQVYNAGTQTASTIYSDNVLTALGNPITSGADGSFDFYAADGRYDLLITHPGHTFASGDTAGISLQDPTYGTWLMDLGGTATYTAREGTYMKLGPLVWVRGSMTVNVIGTGTTNLIDGLPFISLGTSALSMGQNSGLAVSPVSFEPQAGTSTTSIYLYGRTAGAAASSLLAMLGNGAMVTISGWYETAE